MLLQHLVIDAKDCDFSRFMANLAICLVLECDNKQEKIMKFVEYQDISRNRIRAYEENRLRVNTEWVNLPCALCAQQLVKDWHPEVEKQMSELDLLPLISLQAADLIIIGYAQQPKWDHSWLKLQATMNARGIGLEQMQSDAAIRTFNVLTTEERPVWLVLID